MDRRTFIGRVAGGLLAVPATRTFNVQAKGPTPTASVTVAAATTGSWVARSTGPGVVWAHNFATDSEINTFVGKSPGGVTHAGNAIRPFRVDDAVTGNAMRFLAFGGRLTADFLASGGPGPRPLQISDATYWPDPATAGSYYVHLCKPQRDQQNNLLLVTAKNGNTLTVTYIPSSGQPMLTTQRDWLVGDHVGHQCAANWTRLFSALKADSNGKGVDDVNNAGGTLRSTADQTNFPHGAQAFGYGWYGRPEYQAQFPTWRPSDYGVNAIDSVLRSNLWDGDEFYLQWREKVDPRFLTLAAVIDPNSEDTRFGRKCWMLQAEMTVPQQITGGYGPSNRYAIPSTPEPMIGMGAYSFGGGLAGRILAANLDGSGTFQPGSQWASTAFQKSFLPAGSAAEFPSGEWVTFLLHVKPGLRWSSDNPSAVGVRNTLVELKFARQADSAYTTVFSMPDQAIVYGSSGPNEDTWTSALPGYNAISLTGYLNIELGSVPPMAAYYVDFAEVVFSKQFISTPA